MKPRLALLIIPASLLLLYTWLADARGPFSLAANFDPEYPYLLNSLNILTGHPPTHLTFHPGTTLQELGAAVVYADWRIRFGNRADIATAVLSNPETFLRDLNLVLVILIAAALWWAAFSLYRATNSIASAIILEASVFLFPNLIYSLSHMDPEPLLIAAGFALIAAVASGRPILAGAVFGFGVVTKFTFLPWIAAAAVFKPRQAGRFFIAAAAAWIVFIFPVRTHLGSFFKSLFRLATHSERYGRGPVGLPHASVFAANLSDFVRVEPALIALVVLYAAILLLNWRESPRILKIGMLILLIQIAATLKHYEPRYAVPAMIFACLMNAVALPRRGWITIAGATIFALGYLHTAVRLIEFSRQARAQRYEAAQLAAKRAELGDCTTIGYYRSSLPGFALNFASEYSGRIVHGPLLKNIYSDQIMYNKFGGGFWSYSMEPRLAAVESMLAHGQCVLMQGSPEGPLNLPDQLALTPVMELKSEALYRLALKR